MNAFLPDQIRLSQVHLRTANLERALAFYTAVLGFKALQHSGSHAALAAAEGPALLLISEEHTATPRAPRSTGLYHFALRYPRRQDLASAVQRLSQRGYPVAGASDHGVSEAIYLSDPDGNGVELYVDRAREQWPRHAGQIDMTTGPLDLDDLLATAPGGLATKAAPAGVELGHIHLHVADLAAAERFYSDFLGLAVTQRSYPGALFLAAGGYHHHIAVNTWAGKNPPARNSVGLISYRFEVPVAEILYCLNHRAPLVGYEARSEPQEQEQRVLQIRDPNGHWLEVQATPGAAQSEPHCGVESRMQVSAQPGRKGFT